ncbi:serine threonine protein kinase : Serine/threonine protein kinase OS=Pirellula staleyi (strain ATCC 27377 / DSM 6068 / ICPB 4128) GN=Psta_3450 PE=3 SV=1: Pkinase [Gemmata massiliana]|uniref:non-specific serine/threonine protein kinase n=1 Tax=Gemmata massiliana TaxID=1210884 RepID=A0A6P2CVN8_9BACT|nr:serine/threonine-protein kinase [Gemmata massiliana]VTR92225.1 serine threonine protein kinase : Serine/threonine protein kinase OS=Pirellula staleyi (strain ATCC 27377 / DSM 6068 / ICPB 4128) GN=Psta_3450 PE=3 SV=1: Pkinase [Gemmata massiliana]
MVSSDRGADPNDRLNSILVDYVEALERGERPDRRRLLDSFPEHARELAAFFATRDRLDRIVAPIRTLAGSGIRRGLQSTQVDTRTDSSTPSEIGQIGDFLLLREVGRGGMGVVYEAEQVSLRRRVALKVLSFASALDPRHLQRFRNEAQAAAQLHHTHIVPVFAVGVERAVHYYAMQFIEGQSLAQLIADLRTANSRSSATALSSNHDTPIVTANSAERGSRGRAYFRRIAELVKQAAEALEYAHQVGVVHRDIKPANLMIDDAGRLWVTDFGLAQMRNDTGLTATGEVVGTALYMSPEQAVGQRGVVDHRTDIYSLGATLYELLTLTPVFDVEDGRALLYQLVHRDPRPPRTVDRSIPPELETIVLKAIAKAPTDRYATAQEFAADLQRFLDDRPVLARRPTLRDRAAKWVRRHRLLVAIAAGCFLLTTVGLAISTALIAREKIAAEDAYRRECRAKEQERQRAEEAEARRLEADQNYLRTRRAVDLFVELSNEELFDFLPLTGLRVRLLEAAIAYYQELSESRADPLVRANLETIRGRVARLHEDLGSLNVVSTLLLLEQPVVRTDIGLTSDAIDQLTPTLDRLRAYRQSSPSQPESPKSQIGEIAAEALKEVQKVLRVDQYLRLHQIFRQIPGPHVFGRPSLEALSLSDAQKIQIRRIRSEALYASLRLWSTAETRSASQPEFEGMWARTNERIIEVLIPSQRTKWAEMVGPPVQGEVKFPLHSSTRPR